MKEDFSNILRSNKLGVKTMNKTLTTHRQRDWKEYNNALKRRASLDFWLREEVIEGWKKVERSGKRGHPFLYSEIAIMFLATISQLFHLPLRQTEGFVRSLFLPFFSPFTCPFLFHPLPKEKGFEGGSFQGCKGEDEGRRDSRHR
jgi:hypothetical protein